MRLGRKVRSTRGRRRRERGGEIWCYGHGGNYCGNDKGTGISMLIWWCDMYREIDIAAESVPAE